MKRRSWKGSLLTLLALSVVAPIPGIVAAVQSAGVARADVCVNVGRRVSVSGCANLADAVSGYVPPPAYYAPLPQDYPPPPPP